jgi:formate hydrogenlyase subunit 3/multisubunit Na+/H+ antiporter MnhD subunit
MRDEEKQKILIENYYCYVFSFEDVYSLLIKCDNLTLFFILISSCVVFFFLSYSLDVFESYTHSCTYVYNSTCVQLN